MPAGVLLVRALLGALGANPVDTALNALGLQALIFLMATLFCSPLQWLFKWTWPARVRRTLGLLGLGYVTVHLSVYVVLDQSLNLALILEDLGKRPFIAVGFGAWVLLLPLGFTSTAASVKRLGYVKWKRLHRLAYLCAALGCVHYYLRVKKDVTQPVLYASVLGVLLSVRAIAVLRGRRV